MPYNAIDRYGTSFSFIGSNRTTIQKEFIKNYGAMILSLDLEKQGNHS